VEEHLIK